MSNLEFINIFAKHIQVYPTNGQPVQQSYIDKIKFKVQTMVTPNTMKVKTLILVYYRQRQLIPLLA